MQIDPVLASIIIALFGSIPAWLSMRSANMRAMAEAKKMRADVEKMRAEADTARLKANTEADTADANAVDKLSAALGTMGLSYVDLVQRISTSVQADNAAVIVELRGRIKVLEDAQQELQKQLVIKDGKLAESEREISNMSSLLKQANERIEQLTLRNAGYETELESVRAQLRDAQREIAELQNKK